MKLTVKDIIKSIKSIKIFENSRFPKEFSYKDIPFVDIFLFKQFLIAKNHLDKSLYYIQRKDNFSYYNFGQNKWTEPGLKNAKYYSTLFDCIDIVEKYLNDTENRT